MVAVQKDIREKNLKSKMILQVHDELVFDVHSDERNTLEKLVKESMEGALELSVPLEVEYKIANNWLDAH
jgi:DNA polymerase-1